MIFVSLVGSAEFAAVARRTIKLPTNILPMNELVAAVEWWRAAQK